MMLLVSVCSVLVTLVAGEQEPTVFIEQGIVKGSVAEDGDYYEFHGIPYADSTSGTNRFKAPRPALPFDGPFVANQKGVKCVRPLGFGFEGTEDCLVANVFTPTLNTASRLPVIVWVKGKEFDQASIPELSFRNFVQKEVVVVSLNYRESILGFLCLGTETAPGNAGLKDIIAGLKWVKMNIAAFGGNPNSITLVGHGSGAAAVDLVTMSPMGKGLVQRAIAQSGNALAPWAVTRDNLKYAIKVAESLGHVVTSTEQLSGLFTHFSVSGLMAIINELDVTDNSLAFAPCVEKHDLEGVETFLSKTPVEIISDAEFLPIPMIIGFVDNEGTIKYQEALQNNWLQRMDSSFTDFIQSDLKFETDDEKRAIAQEIKQFYFRENPINMANIGDYLRYHGDTMVMVSSIREVVNRVSNLLSPIYLYQFSYSGNFGEPFVGPLNLKSAAHSEELAYMFYSTRKTETPDKDETVGNILIERWTNFAKTGVPTSETSLVSWLPVTRNHVNFLRFLEASEVIDKTMEVALQDPHFSTVSFWNSIYVHHFLDAESNWQIGDTTEGTTTLLPPITPPTGENTTTATPTDDITSTAPPNEITSTPPVDGISSSTPAEGISSTTPAEGISSSSHADGISSISPAEGISSTTPAEGISLTTPAEGISSSSPADGISSISPAEGISSTTPADGISSTPTPDGILFILTKLHFSVILG